MDQDLHCLMKVICLMVQIRRYLCAVLAVDLGPVTVTVSYTDKQTAGISIRLLVSLSSVAFGGEAAWVWAYVIYINY